MPVKSVDEFIEKHPHWQSELESLREMLLGTNLEETIKWGVPVYTLNGKNVVGTAAFKNHISLWFYQGALLKDNTALLYTTQEVSPKAMRQIRFEKGDPINVEMLRKYVLEAIGNEREGKRIKPEKNKELLIPVQLTDAFKENSALKTAFESLTPGKQREYAGYLTEAKREETKLKRLQKISPMILKGEGLHDKYKN